MRVSAVRVIATWLLPFVCGSTIPLQAAIVSFDFAGTVTELDLNAGFFGPAGTVNVGDTFTGHFSYDTGPSNPDLQPADSEVGAYRALNFVVDGSPVVWTDPRILIRHRFVPGVFPNPPTSIDSFTVSAAPGPFPYDSLLHFTIRGPFESAFADDSLPTSLDLAEFTDDRQLAGIRVVGLIGDTIDDHGTIDSLSFVPEPVFAAFLGPLAGAFLLAALNSRRRVR